jgi:MFS family permease
MEYTERRTILAIWRRIVPLLSPVLFFAYLDRVNLGFAALTMNQDLHLTNTQFGTAAGCFAVGYAVAGIPSTLMLHRLGARRWISLTMLIWGLCSAATAFVTRPQELFGVRALLGMAEAGLAPGVVLYTSRWFPSEYRGRMFGTLFMINPLSQLIGSPLSSVLLAADGRLGLAGWQWLFIVEALPTLLLAAVVFGRCTLACR